MGINSNVFPHTAHGKFILKRVKIFFLPGSILYILCRSLIKVAIKGSFE